MGKLIAVLLGAAVQTPREPEPRPGFFGDRGVNFWREGSLSRAAGAKGGAVSAESIWAEPVRLPDGRYATYVPPRAVLEFLENPTREGARKYLEWQAERLERMRKAAALLAELQRGNVSETPRADLPVAITYFRKPGCPACARQDVVLSGLRERLPLLAVRPVEPGEEPELWRRLGITSVPALLVSVPGRRPVLLRGLAGADRILSAIEGVPHEGQ